MAKKKKKTLSKNQIIQLGCALLIVGLIGFALGNSWSKARLPYNSQNTVITADSSVKVPNGLVAFLKKQTRCKNLKSIGIWSIYQTADNKFAKIAYGCGVSLESYIMAVKQNNTWILLPTNKYFLPAKDGGAVSGYGPSCSILAQYSISKDIEPVCVTAKGQSKVVAK